MNILTLNAGTATLKYALFQMTDETVLIKGTEEQIGSAAIIDAAEQVIRRCQPLGVDAVGYRIVHGGPRFWEPTRVDPDVLIELRALEPLDPLHNQTEVALIEAGQRLLPGTPAVALFDTAFHRTLPEVAWRYALPRELSQHLNLRRYGFHGLSHCFVSENLLRCLGRSADGTRLITCHLGSGASLCALRDGRSMDTSMGMTSLEGLVMGTRSGDIDPGLLLYLQRVLSMTANAVDALLNQQSGLLGLSDRSSDVRDLEYAAQHGDAFAEMSLAVFAYRIRKYIGAYAAALGGLDAVALTGGIGEHSAKMRARVCYGLEFLGLQLDTDRNEAASGAGPAQVSRDTSPVSVWMIPTDEQRQIARETATFLWGSA